MKIMKALHRLSRTALVIVVAAATWACADFLDGPPQGALDEGTLANSMGVEAALISTYRALDAFGPVTTWYHAASNWIWGSITSDEAAKGSEASDQPQATDIELYNWTTGQADTEINNRWRGLYEGINRANATIRLLDQVTADDPTEISQANQDRIRGEALFLRAHFHFEAHRMWGGVPYYTDADTTFRKAQLSASETLAAIEADLDAAIALLPATQDDVGRATVWTARAYKGKVQVYDQNWTGAIATLGQVVNSGPYDLEADYSLVYTGYTSLENGPETILAYQASANDGEPSGNNANYGNRLNFPHSGSPFGCCGFHQPTQNMVNFHRVDANGLPLSMSGTWDDIATNLDATASATMLLDPRLDWTVGRDGVPFYDWGNHEAGWIRAPAYGGPYSMKKTVYESGSGAASQVGWVATQLSSMNQHIYRFADVLLLLAEAEVEGGSLENARTHVNRIRARAAVAAQGPNGGPLTVGINDASITWADYEVGQYTTAWTDQTYARNAVQAERKIELSMEGERFFDLRRWGIAESVLNAFLASELPRRSYLSGAAAFAAKHYLYPLPSTQIELSTVDEVETLTQNSGW
jgi:hypothetical protein